MVTVDYETNKMVSRLVIDLNRFKNSEFKLRRTINEHFDNTEFFIGILDDCFSLITQSVEALRALQHENESIRERVESSSGYLFDYRGNNKGTVIGYNQDIIAHYNSDEFKSTNGRIVEEAMDVRCYNNDLCNKQFNYKGNMSDNLLDYNNSLNQYNQNYQLKNNSTDLNRGATCGNYTNINNSETRQPASTEPRMLLNNSEPRQPNSLEAKLLNGHEANLSNSSESRQLNGLKANLLNTSQPILLNGPEAKLLNSDDIIKEISYRYNNPSAKPSSSIELKENHEKEQSNSEKLYYDNYETQGLNPHNSRYRYLLRTKKKPSPERVEDFETNLRQSDKFNGKKPFDRFTDPFGDYFDTELHPSSKIVYKPFEKNIIL
jgi:hypothetical protein